jgi:hypothetical protein
MWIIVLAGVVAAAALLVLSRRREGGGTTRRLQTLGFSPCDEEANTIAESIAAIHDNPRYRFSVRNPMRAEVDSDTVYYCEAQRQRHENASVALEFVVPLRRPTLEAVLLVIKPTSVPHGMVTRLIGNIATASWDAQPGGIERLDLPRELQDGNIIAACGPAGSGVPDLIQPNVLDRAHRLGDMGVLMMLCRGDWCRLISPSPQIPLRPAELWTVVQSFVAERPRRDVPVS